MGPAQTGLLVYFIYFFYLSFILQIIVYTYLDYKTTWLELVFNYALPIQEFFTFALKWLSGKILWNPSNRLNWIVQG